MKNDNEPLCGQSNTQKIRELNDAFRTTLLGGKVVTTAGVHALGPERVAGLLRIVRAFDTFDEGNDPYGEHDFGAFDDGGQKFFWKIDTYDKSLRYGSEDPADPGQTVRVLTLLFAEEW
jgi:hypothetical protein